MFWETRYFVWKFENFDELEVPDSSIFFAETLHTFPTYQCLHRESGRTNREGKLIGGGWKSRWFTAIVSWSKRFEQSYKERAFPTTKFEDISTRLLGATHFTKLDAKKGYWQIPLDEESAKLTTMNTSFGRYKFLRLPYGMLSAQEVFHRVINGSFTDSWCWSRYWCFLIIIKVSLHHWREQRKSDWQWTWTNANSIPMNWYNLVTKFLVKGIEPDDTRSKQ